MLKASLNFSRVCYSTLRLILSEFIRSLIFLLVKKKYILGFSIITTLKNHSRSQSIIFRRFLRLIRSFLFLRSLPSPHLFPFFHFLPSLHRFPFFHLFHLSLVSLLLSFFSVFLLVSIHVKCLRFLPIFLCPINVIVCHELCLWQRQGMEILNIYILLLFGLK